MCAIGGIYRKQEGIFSIQKYIRKMIEIQHHRGPDAKGEWYSKNQLLGLCHNRLAILDLSKIANQPMQSLDNRYTIVFNGEIYNYKQLKFELENEGCKFKTNTDTEVLIEAYRKWGDNKMLNKLRGMFAFSIYDSKTRVLFCARDRFGEKPFVYAQTENAFIFASEIPAIKQVEGVNLTYNKDAIAGFFLHNFRHIPDPNTAYLGINRLRSGHAMIVIDGKINKIWRYWSPSLFLSSITAEILRKSLEEAVDLQMQADVPVGALLSGGIDSSAIVALMQKRSFYPIRTYALGFDSNDEDLKRARTMSKLIGTVHKEFYFDSNQQWDIFQLLIKKYGDPIMLLPLIHTYVISSAIRQDGIKVVLTGNGADELFYGYTGHIRTLKISKIFKYIDKIKNYLSFLEKTPYSWLIAKNGERKAKWYLSIAHQEWKNWFTEDVLPKLQNVVANELAYWGKLCLSPQYIDESNFVALMTENTSSVTIAGDLPAMAASIEFRSPFLDPKITTIAFSTPVDKKISDPNNPNWLKAILREAVTDLLPKTILNASKRGFGMGIQESDILKNHWRLKAEEIFSNPENINGLFDTKKIKKNWQQFLKGKFSATSILKMLAIQIWAKNI